MEGWWWRTGDTSLGSRRETSQSAHPTLQPSPACETVATFVFFSSYTSSQHPQAFRSSHAPLHTPVDWGHTHGALRPPSARGEQPWRIFRPK